MPITVNDRVSYRVESKRQYTDEGFLKVPARVARTGIQQYLASELGIKERSPNSIINVYRPADQVFDQSSLESYAGKDVTNDHPSDMVSADNYKNLTCGHVASSGRQDGDFVVCDLIIKDAATIKLVESGKVQLSAGYTAEYEPEKGFADGVEYEFVQRDIKINHVALVERARAGAQARVFDGSKEGGMPKITLDSGKAIEVADEAVAALLQDTFDRQEEQVEKLTADMEMSEKEKEKLQAEKDALEEENKDMKKKTGDAFLADRVASVVAVKDAAAIVAGDKFSCDSFDETEIKRAAISAVRDGDFSDKSKEYIDAAFDFALESAKTSTSQKATADKSIAEFAKDAAGGVVVKDARQEYISSTSNAWKKTVGAE